MPSLAQISIYIQISMIYIITITGSPLPHHTQGNFLVQLFPYLLLVYSRCRVSRDNFPLSAAVRAVCWRGCGEESRRETRECLPADGFQELRHRSRAGDETLKCLKFHNHGEEWRVAFRHYANQLFELENQFHVYLLWVNPHHSVLINS